MSHHPSHNKRVHLSIQKKLDVIDKLERGVSVAKICDEYGIAKQTVSDFKKSKQTLRRIASKCSLQYGSRSSIRKSTIVERKQWM